MKAKQFTHNLEKAKRQAAAEREKLLIFGRLKTNLYPNERNKLLKRYNSL